MLFRSRGCDCAPLLPAALPIAAALFSAVIVLTPSQALAQATANAITDADDAFGTNNGVESVGIYNEFSVRGFSLEAAGNYRVNGRYFVKSSGVSNFFVEKSDVRIGYNTMGLDFPGPSGVVDFRLRDPGPDAPILMTVGLDAYEQPTVDLLYQHGNEAGTVGATLGLGLGPATGDEQGGGGEDALLAGVFRYSPSDRVRLHAFGGEYTYRKDGRFSAILAPEVGALPGPIQRERYLGQDWARTRGQKRIVGLLADFGLGGGWQAAANAVFSQDDPTRGYSQLFLLAPEGSGGAVVAGSSASDRSMAVGSVGNDVVAGSFARSMTVASPAQRFTAYSGEASVGWRGESFGARHDINGHVRVRVSRNRLGGSQLIDGGVARFGLPAAPIPVPQVAGKATARDAIDDVGLGVSWQGRSERLRWNIGLVRTSYEKRFTTGDGVPGPDGEAVSGSGSTTGSGLGAAGSRSTTTTDPWLFNAGAAWALGRRVVVYGSYSRGLEEAGLAPATASNRNEVLEAGIVTQREFGFRITPRPGVGVIIAGFDTRKPLPGIERDGAMDGGDGPDGSPAGGSHAAGGSNTAGGSSDTGRSNGTGGVYRLIGDVRHRGVELSLSGALTSNLSVVIGGVFTDAEVESPGVRAGTIGERPVAVPWVRAVASVNYLVPGVAGLSLDGNVEHVGEQVARSAMDVSRRQLRVPASTVLDLGFRYGFGSGRAWTLRGQVQNVANDFSWQVTTAETLHYNPPRRFRVLVTRAF